MHKYLIMIFLSAMLFMSNIFAEPLSVTGSDNIQSVLLSQKGNRVAIQLRSGIEMKGKVGEINGEIVHLMGLTGKEFFDAVISMKAIEAVVIRTKK